MIRKIRAIFLFVIIFFTCVSSIVPHFWKAEAATGYSPSVTPENHAVPEIDTAPNNDIPSHSVIPHAAAAPTLSISAQMGGSFRTIDLTVTLANMIPFPSVYYLALAQGQPEPSIQQVLDYANGRETKGLSDGSVVRGRWFASMPYEQTVLSLSGSENIRREADETGFIDGYRYDIYVVAVGRDGSCSPMEAAYDIMAQPFEYMSADQKTFTLRALDEEAGFYPDLGKDHALNAYGHALTARQLENIQRLADLYTETNGTHGSLAFLTGGYTYVLDSDIDLSAYQSWTPIGNTDKNASYVFNGIFDGQNHTIKNLTIDTNIWGKPGTTQGLFGSIEGAEVRFLTLEDAAVYVEGDFNQKECAVGVLAGESIDGVIDHITLRNAVVTVFASESGSGLAGGVTGCSMDTHMYDINVEQTMVYAYDNRVSSHSLSGSASQVYPYHARAAGGIVGYYGATRNNRLLKNLTSTAHINMPLWDSSASLGAVSGKTVETCTGGIAGIIAVSGSQDKTLHAEGLYSEGTVEGGLFTGGLAGLLTAAPDSNREGQEEYVTFDRCRFTGNVKGCGFMGGLFGEARSEGGRAVLVKQSDASGYIGVSEAAHNHAYVLGGLAGSLAGCVVEYCLSYGPALTGKTTAETGYVNDRGQYNDRLTGGSGIVGGFAGMAKDTYFTQCYARRDVTGVPILNGTGGFVGTAADTDFQTCGVEAHLVTGGNETGGFIGRIEGIGRVFNCYAVTAVEGGSRTGGFVGLVQGEPLAGNTGHEIEIRLCSAGGQVKSTGGITGGFAGELTYCLTDQCRASGSVYTNAGETGGFCGRLSHMSRITNAYAIGNVVSTASETGGFAGRVTNASCVEYAYASGDVVGQNHTGGFVGSITQNGAPNTLTHCISFAQRIIGAKGGVNRFAGQLAHEGVNECYAGSDGLVVSGQSVTVVTPNAFGKDGADIHKNAIAEVLGRLNWNRRVWDYETGGLPLLAEQP